MESIYSNVYYFITFSIKLLPLITWNKHIISAVKMILKLSLTLFHSGGFSKTYLYITISIDLSILYCKASRFEISKVRYFSVPEDCIYLCKQ